MDAPKCRVCEQRHWGLCPDARKASGESRKGARVRVEGHAGRSENGEAQTGIVPSASRSQPNIGGIKPAPRAPQRGRPRIEDRGKTLMDSQPWKAVGMSRASWYRRKKEQKQ